MGSVLHNAPQTAQASNAAVMVVEEAVGHVLLQHLFAIQEGTVMNAMTRAIVAQVRMMLAYCVLVYAMALVQANAQHVHGTKASLAANAGQELSTVLVSVLVRLLQLAAPETVSAKEIV